MRQSSEIFEARKAIVGLIREWVTGVTTLQEFNNRYWPLRRCVLSKHPEVFTGDSESFAATSKRPSTSTQSRESSHTSSTNNKFGLKPRSSCLSSQPSSERGENQRPSPDHLSYATQRSDSLY
jgi:hypothetical protein